MKILAIYFGAGSGISIFYQRIICELAKNAEIDVLSDCEVKESFVGVRNQAYAGVVSPPFALVWHNSDIGQMEPQSGRYGCKRLRCCNCIFGYIATNACRMW